MTTAPDADPGQPWGLLFRGFHYARQLFSSSSCQTYDLTAYECGLDFMFEPIGEGKNGYITAQQHGVKSGDILVLNSGGITQKYRIEQIDYYPSPPDLWTAYLSRID